MNMDGVDLQFTKEALGAIAARAQGRKTGARGLRSILEEVMLDVMYDLPSMTNVKKCIVNKDVIEKKDPPALVYQEQKKEPA